MNRKPIANASAIFLCLLFMSGNFCFEAQQIWSWGNMLVDFDANKSFKVAVNETFSGESPCELCTKLTKEKTQETKELPFSASQEADEIFVDEIREWISDHIQGNTSKR